ncbi:hypothetical protein CPB83DRAFT_97576 [Crepidotus variabilis]|uniref:Uncharacterized protein n=1 Tax=Crepidotus variabilis TaxID=179855 RepID=A0A9P6ELZ5_9AGAR|nr:hypothetical protein CPB83DRAFT_97576 [Crepidotus variabilis]
MSPSNNASSSKIPSASQAGISRSKSTRPTRQLQNPAESNEGSGNLRAQKERAKRAFDRLKTVGMPDKISFDAFLELYLGEGEEATSGAREDKKESANEKTLKLKKRTQTKDIKKEDTLPNSQQIQFAGVADALDRLSERLVGRTQVAKVRQEINAAQARGDLEDLVAQEEAKRESLSGILASVKAEWEVESRKVKELEERKSMIAMRVDDLKRKMVLLGVLEALENVRMKRLGSTGEEVENVKGTKEGKGQGVGDLINGLRQEVILASRDINMILMNTQKKSLPELSISTTGHQRGNYSPPELAYQHSTIALANLHAYHARLKRVKAARPIAEPTSVPSSKEDLQRRLEKALRGAGVLAGTEQQELQTKLMIFARRRAEKERRRTLSVPDANLSVEDLKKKQCINEAKRKEVQRLLNRVVALGWVCEGYVDLISTFRQETAPTLEKLLDEEQKRVEGRVDLMKAEILKHENQNLGGC